jgi:hypothetical protein
MFSFAIIVRRRKVTHTLILLMRTLIHTIILPLDAIARSGNAYASNKMNKAPKSNEKSLAFKVTNLFVQINKGAQRLLAMSRPRRRERCESGGRVGGIKGGGDGQNGGDEGSFGGSGRGDGYRAPTHPPRTRS